MDDAVIDSLCGKTYKILVASLELFDALMTPSASATDIANLRVKVSVYMKMYREMFRSVQPKALILEDHAVEQYILHFENGLPLVVEQFVERNHQDGKRHCEQSKRIQDTQIWDNNHVRRKWLDNLGAIKKRQKLVHVVTARKKWLKGRKGSTKTKRQLGRIIARSTTFSSHLTRSSWCSRPCTTSPRAIQNSHATAAHDNGQEGGAHAPLLSAEGLPRKK